MRLGFSAKAIRHRIVTGRLHPIYRGINAVDRGELTKEGRWRAALLVCGDDAYLSHGSAAKFWGFERERGSIEVVLVREVAIRRPGLQVHRRPALLREDVLAYAALPVTSPLRALLDLATYLDLKRLERAVNEASSLDLVDPERLRRWLDLRAGKPGVRPLRALLDRDTFRLSDTELEVLFRPLALAAGLPNRRPKSRSTASRSTSSGPSSAWSLRRTASASTAPPASRRAICSATRPTSPAASPRSASTTTR